MNLKKLSPWNWFKHEDSNETNVAVNQAQGYNLPMNRLHREIDHIFENFFSRPGFPRLFENSEIFDHTSFFKPTLDISENLENYKIVVDLPGVSEKDITVEQQDDILTIKGQKENVIRNKEEKYHSIERTFGSFQRSLSLPNDADPHNIDAKFTNGVLTIVIAKSQTDPKNTRSIEIN